MEYRIRVLSQSHGNRRHTTQYTNGSASSTQMTSEPSLIYIQKMKTKAQIKCYQNDLIKRKTDKMFIFQSMYLLEGEVPNAMMKKMEDGSIPTPQMD